MDHITIKKINDGPFLLPEGLSKKELGLADNKSIVINSIAGIHIERFRAFFNEEISLGSHVTVFSGRNGTMKTSLMGLIAHPFTSQAKDGFDNTLKTTLKEVFKLSPKHDQDDYNYSLILELGKGKYLREPVQIYWVGDKTNRHRVVVSGSEKGDGNLTYNTSFLNLKRLYPLVDANAKLDVSNEFALSPKEESELKNFYETVFPSSEYSQFTGVYKDRYKTTYAPSGDSAKHDWLTISSGEDNLGAIFNRLIGFQRAHAKSKIGNGVLCIDEFEASLHPVAQIRLFNYLYRWAGEYNVQVVITTHSLGLISDIYASHAQNIDANRICMNFISKSLSIKGRLPILKNPPFALAYKELTMEDPQQAAEARKIKVFCEDDIAVHFAKKLIGSQKILRAIDFKSSLNPVSPTPGMSYTELKPLANTCARFPALLDGCLVLLDPDVPAEFLKKIKDKNLYLLLPDPANIAIERRIITWIIGLDNGDPFFKKFGERDRFLDQFKQKGLESLNPDAIIDEKVVSIASCKNWALSNLSKFKTYVTYYAKSCDGKTEFQEIFLATINKINTSSGLPEIEL